MCCIPSFFLHSEEYHHSNPIKFLVFSPQGALSKSRETAGPARPPGSAHHSERPAHFDSHYFKHKGKVISCHLKNFSYLSTQFHGVTYCAWDTGQEIVDWLVWRRRGWVGWTLFPPLHWFIQECNKERTAVTGAPRQQYRNVQSREGQGLCPQSILSMAKLEIR